ncbi:MAG: acetate/propionate family kinase [Candidatus Binataceae bacterium]
MKILVFNCGSSTLKFELLELDIAKGRRGSVIGRGNFERIGEDHGEAILVDGDQAETRVAADCRDHGQAASQAIAWLERLTAPGGLQVDATAHRIVHGGPHLFGPAILDDNAMKELEEAASFAPLHNPPALAAIRAAMAWSSGVPAVVLADTAFHRDLPDYASNYALPRELVLRHGIRRFGFHGIGHAWMMERYAELTGSDPAAINLITLHLGAGCSATAIRRGKSVDTSMGFTPLEGLMMATRSGDLDPAIVSFLCDREKISPAEVESLLNHKSGLLGVSGVSGDLREVQASADQGNSDAALAIEMFCYRVRKYVGQYLAVPGRTEAVIFGGGIGEHADRIRARVCEGLEHLGIGFDPERNRAANGRESRFSAEDAKVELYVIPLDEELYIARAAARLLLAGQVIG